MMQAYRFGNNLSLAFIAKGPNNSTPVFWKIKFSLFGILKSGTGAIWSCNATAFCQRQSKHRLIIVRKVVWRLITIRECWTMKRQCSSPVCPLWLWISLSTRKVICSLPLGITWVCKFSSSWFAWARSPLALITPSSEMKGKKLLILECTWTFWTLQRQSGSSSNESSWDCLSS